MKKNKLLCLLLCVVMVASLVMPGTWAMETQATETTTETQTVETTTATTEPTATKETSEPTETPTESTTAPTEAKETEPSDPTEETKKVEETEATEPTQETTEATVPETTEEAEKTCTCGAAEGEFHAVDCPMYVEFTFEEVSEARIQEIYETIMSMHSAYEFSKYIPTLTGAEANAVISRMTEADWAALFAAFEAGEPVETLGDSYTNVGPLKGATSLPGLSVMRRNRAMLSAPAEADNGLILNKTAEATGNPGEYKITMEAYTTGIFKNNEKSVPVDVILVLDESGSMGDSFGSTEYTPVYGDAITEGGTYYVKTGNGYERVHYCTGIKNILKVTLSPPNAWWETEEVHTPGWYTNSHTHVKLLIDHSTDPSNYGSLYVPKTSASDSNSDHVQFYTQYSTKLDALHAAAGLFVNRVHQDAVANNVDHRVAVVGFSSNSSVKVGLNTKSDEDIRNNYQDVYNAATNTGANGGTYIEKGAQDALDQFAKDTRSGERKRVVIFFTDGIPGSGTWNDTTITGSANPAIEKSYALKNTYGATVYSIAMMSDADPSLPISNGTTNKDRTNKFMHYLSSNYPNATSMSNGGAGGNNGYYLKASSGDSLNEIFRKIADNISTPTISLGSNTVIRDTVTQYFDMPENASAVTVKKVPCTSYNETTGATAWDESRAVTLDNAASIEGNVVNVTGFDFDKNFISANDKGNGDHGSKVVIEFTVNRKDEFIGGNDVPTNEWQDSGVYNKGTLVENFNNANNTPTVNVPITEPTVTPHDKTIYEGKATAVSGLYDPVNDTGWQYDYVDVTQGVGGVTGDEVSPADCTPYTVTVTYKPISNGAGSAGQANGMDGVSKDGTATVHVLKPTVNVTVNDVEAAYGEDYTLGDKADAKVTFVTWTDKTDGHTKIPAVAAGTKEPYTKDDLTFAYECVDKTITVTDGKITVPDKDVDVTVTVKHGDTVLTDAIITTTCTIQDSGCTTPDTDKIYTVHVTSCKLTIKKAGKAYDASDSFIFDIFDKDNNKVATVTLHMDKEITISGLKKGTYTVSERTTGTRYNDQKAQEVNLTPKGYTVTFTNSVKTDTWLTNSDSEHNVFNGMPTDKG